MTNASDNKNEKENNLENQIGTMSDEEINFSTEVGEIVFESALVKFMADKTEEEIEEFQTFISLYANADNLMEKLYQEYPAFGEILNEEAKAMNEELSSLTINDDNK